jgi:T5SS/PEP-CTERM-associated repeat protein
MHTQKFRWGVALAVIALVIGSVGPVEASYFFQESVGDWTNANHWSDGSANGVPGSSDAAYIGTTSGGGEPDATCSLDTDEQCYSLYLGSGVGQIGRLNITDGSLDVTRGNADWSFQFGARGSGIINQSGGIFNLLGVNCRMGVYAEGAGTLNLSGGSFTNVANMKCGDAGLGTINLSSDGKMWVSTATYLGYTSGTGVVNQTGGTWDNGGGGISIAQAVGTSGEYTLSGGVLTNVGTLYIGNAGYGTFELSGSGVLAPPAGDTRVGDDATGTGVVTVTSGTWNNGNNNFELGYAAGGVGTLNLSGGSLTNVDYLLCPRAGHGTINLSGTGLLELSGSNPAHLGFSGGTGVVNQTGGTWDNGGQHLYVGYSGSDGTYDASGGSLENVANLHVGHTGSGTFALSGSATVGPLSAISYVGYSATGNGVVNQSGGTWNNGGYSLSVGELDGATGEFNISDGVLTNVGTLYVGNAGNGTLTLSGTGEIASPGGPTYVSYDADSVGVVNQTGGNWNNGNQNLELGYVAGSDATLNLSGGSLTNVNYLLCPRDGSATINLSGSGLLGVSGTESRLGNSGGSGVVNQTGGTWDNGGTHLRIGYVAGSVGTYSISSGSLTNVNYLYVGSSGNGTFNISGDAHVTPTKLYIAGYAGSEGLLSITGSGATIETEEFRAANPGSGTLRVTPDSGGISTIVVTGGNKTWIYETTLEVDFSNYRSTDDLTIIDYGSTLRDANNDGIGYELAATNILTAGWSADVDYLTDGEVRLVNISRPTPPSMFSFR